jgi:hypothetical protein
MATKSSLKSRLVVRAAQGGRNQSKVRPGTTAAEVPEAGSAAGASVMSIAGLKIPGVPLEKVQETARKVVGYAKENPLTAVAAVGAGVALTAVFWDDISRVARRGTRRFR